MGLKEIKSIRQYTSFDVDGKVVKMYEVSFTTEKAPGTFTLDISAEEYTAEEAKKRAVVKAEEIDKAIG